MKPSLLPKARILVIEEDADLRAGLGELLADQGYRLADDASAAGLAPVDLVLAGVRRARSACAGLAALSRLDRAVPVIVLADRATWIDFDFLDAANELGAAAVLQRPFSRAELLRLMAAVLSGSAARDDAAEEHIGSAELLLQMESPYFV